MYSTRRAQAKENQKNMNYKHRQTSDSSYKQSDSTISDTDRNCLLYVRDLSLDIGHHEIFEHFCIFGTLKRVNVHQRNGFSKYATILFSSSEAIDLAIRANPHKLRDKHFFCNKMGSWHLRWPTIDKQIPLPNSRSTHQEYKKKNISKDHQMQSYAYPATANQIINNCKAEHVDSRSALLPEASKVLLQQLRKAQTPPVKLVKKRPQELNDVYRQSLLTSMGKNFTFVRHSYTDFMAYNMRNGAYRRVSTNAQISLTADTYAAERDQANLCRPFYTNFE